MSIASRHHEPPRQPPRLAAASDPEIEAVLRDTAALWAAVRKTTGEYIAVVDRDGVIRDCNRVDEGFTPDQVIGHSFVRFTMPESSAALLQVLRQVFEDGETRMLETTVRRLDDSLNYFLLRLSPILQAGRTVAVMVCCEGVRPLKDSEQALTRERNVLKRLLEIQERERQLVSYEIHDGLAQYLAAAILHLQAYAHGQNAGSAHHDFAAGMRLLEAAAAESRRLIGGLRPPALDELGIVAAIESLVEEARADIPAVEFTHRLPGDRLPPLVETLVFRIVQESLTNARKHARARVATVTVERSAGGLMIRVQDDGTGFDPAAVPEDCFGLEGIRQRCRLCGGESRITSAPGAGTTVEVTLPVPAGA